MRLVITPPEFLDQVKQIVDGNYSQEGLYLSWVQDPEDAHTLSDKLMEEILISLGYSEGIKIIRKQTRWYA